LGDLNGKKAKGFPYSLPSIGPGANPSVQAHISHPPGSRLPLLSARPAVSVKKSAPIIPKASLFGITQEMTVK